MIQEISFEDISYLELCRLFCSAKLDHLCNFIRGYHKKQFREIILKFGPVVQEEISFIRFLIWISGGPGVHWSETIYAIVGRWRYGQHSCEIILNWISGSRGVVV